MAINWQFYHWHLEPSATASVAHAQRRRALTRRARRLRRPQLTQATECYDMVDLHIRRLDKDLALFDKEAARLGGGLVDSPDRAAALAAAMAAAAGGKPAKSHAKRSGKAGASPAQQTQQRAGCVHGAAAVVSAGLRN
jgi:hypothetical protein